jgi:hypothetical protein
MQRDDWYFISSTLNNEMMNSENNQFAKDEPETRSFKLILSCSTANSYNEIRIKI